MIKIILFDKDGMITMDEFNELVKHADNETEENLYTLIYNYLLHIAAEKRRLTTVLKGA